MNAPVGGREVLLPGALLAILIEGVTLFVRYGLQLHATRDTAGTIGRLTMGIRIHHGYVGVLLLAVAFAFFVRRPIIFRWVVVAGAALVASDLIHHFLVLWPVEGSPQFDFVYPE